jgi:GNAT superfamily N-acetyltransferase
MSTSWFDVGNWRSGMIEVARPDHLDLVARIVKSAAATGSWDPELGVPGPALDALLAKLQHAFVHGFVPRIDPRTGQWMETHIAGYVYRFDATTPPIGFGLFKDFTATGYELWLLGIDEPFQGRGCGRAMIEELLATPLGKRAELARCALASEGSRRCAHLLKLHGFESCRTTASEEWLLHRRTPSEIVRLVMTVDMVPASRGRATSSLSRQR